jgi:hypothetical protein
VVIQVVLASLEVEDLPDLEDLLAVAGLQVVPDTLVVLDLVVVEVRRAL